VSALTHTSSHAFDFAFSTADKDIKPYQYRYVQGMDEKDNPRQWIAKIISTREDMVKVQWLYKAEDLPKAVRARHPNIPCNELFMTSESTQQSWVHREAVEQVIAVAEGNQGDVAGYWCSRSFDAGRNRIENMRSNPSRIHQESIDQR
jgi:hypothetical protein